MQRGMGRSVWGAWCCGAIVAAAPWLAGCATIFGYSGPQDVELAATPAEAEYELTTTRGVVVRTGALPATVSMKTKWNYTLKVSAPGYKEKVVPIDSSFNYWTLCNAICWPGFLLDGLNGAMFTLPEEVHVALRPLDGGAVQPTGPGAPPSPPPGYAPPMPPTQNDDAPDGTVQAPGGRLHLVLTRRNNDGELMMRVVPLEPLAEASRL